MAGRVATVTLLFSDIEGSTRLWEDHPEEMGTALARHDQLLYTAMSESGGHVFKTLGDGFCVVFDRALDGIAAALATQRSLGAEPWPGVVQPRVRVALHSGQCELRDGDYFGRPVNRVARLLAAGHGGQTLVSEATAQDLRDALPEGVELRDLGVHRLRDLGDPEHIYQVDAAGLERAFKPLRTLANPALANNLPLQTASFVGRSHELEAVATSLDASRLVTLAGAGGCGKTRLAVQVAADLLDNFADGVWLVELAPLRAPELVVEALATTVGVSVPPGRALPALLDTLSDRTMLVVLDNCEHVVEAAAKLSEAVLQACPNVTLLCTSRERLGVDGELVYRVPSLPVPDAEVVGIDRLATFDAVRLFAERAVQHAPGFVLDESNGAAVASVCRRLDGIPLAIELAAARLGVLSVAEVDARLDQRFRLLTSGSRTALPRQQTLRALVDWSWDLLEERERTTLCRLSVFAGGWTLEAVEAVVSTADVEDWEVLHLLGALVDKSLVQADTTGDATRYKLLETVREYAAEQLTALGEEAVRATRHAHCLYYLSVAETAAERLIGPDQRAWYDRLETEYDNLRAAVAFGATDPQSAEAGLQLRVALRWFWAARGIDREVFGTVVARPDELAPPRVRAKALIVAGELATQVGDYSTARARIEEALAVAERVADLPLVADALVALSWLAFLLGDTTEALRLHDHAVAIPSFADDLHLHARASRLRAMLFAEDGAIAEACAADERALLLSRTLGDARGAALTLNNLGAHEIAAGRLGEARLHLSEVLDIARTDRDQINPVYARSNLGLLAIVEGRYAEARGVFVESLASARRIGLQASVAYSVLGLAFAASGCGDAELAATLHGAADAAFAVLGETLEPLEADLNTRDTAALIAALGPDGFASAHRCGLELTRAEAVTVAIESATAG